jgi:hypothetical protein
LACNALERERDARRFAGSAHTLVDLRCALGAAEFHLQIGAPIHPLGWKRRIELEGMPAHGNAAFCMQGRDQAERSLETAHADVAPGTHDIGDDVDRQR